MQRNFSQTGNICDRRTVPSIETGINVRFHTWPFSGCMTY